MESSRRTKATVGAIALSLVMSMLAIWSPEIASEEAAGGTRVQSTQTGSKVLHVQLKDGSYSDLTSSESTVTTTVKE